MIIKELNHKPEYSIKNATVELTYDEIRDIANGFVFLCHQGEKGFVPTDAEIKCFKERKKSFSILFDLVKHGTVTDFTIEHNASIECPSDCKGVNDDT
jgi:hypothetical protein